MNIEDANVRAATIGETLRMELEKVIKLSKDAGPQYDSWITRYFEPALEKLTAKERSPIGRLADACFNLQIFGGMGSWSDVGVDSGESFYRAYKEANDFYQECWENELT